MLREAYAHPTVQGIVMFAGPAAAGFGDTTLADLNFHNTANGDVVDRLIREWKSDILGAETDSEGLFEVSLFHGEHEVTVTHPRNNKSYGSSRINVAKEEESGKEILHLIAD